MRSYESHIAISSDYYLYTPSTLARQMFFYPICVGYFYYEPDYFLKREQYNSFLVMLITKGSCTLTLKNKQLTAYKGDVVFLNCYEPHAYGSETEWEASWLHFDGPLASLHYEHITSNWGNVIATKNTHIFEHNLNKICNIFRNSQPIREATISKYITLILTELLLTSSTSSIPNASLQLEDTITYITENFVEPISLSDLATRASLSPFYFTRIFTKETGMTPHQYLIATRLNAAKFLLKTTTFSIKEIAFNSGFTSESSFCTTFKKWESLTPSAYRFLGLTK